MALKYLIIKNHPILKNIDVSFLNKEGKPYHYILLIGENGVGKSTLLNEIYNYEQSSYIENKEEGEHKALFLRQDSKFSHALNEISAFISKDKVPYPFSTSDTKEILDIDLAKIFASLHSDRLYEVSNKQKHFNLSSGHAVTKLITNKEYDLDLSNFSSGEQEMLLKFSLLKNLEKSVNSVLIDEPETSLHPRWQLEIIPLLKKILTDDEDRQVYIATHSPFILKSCLQLNDFLIIAMRRLEEGIDIKRITHLDLALSYVSDDEINYLIYHLPSFIYHDLLFNELLERIRTDENDSILVADRYIRNHPYYLENKNKYKRVWKSENKNVGSKTLPSYIRNYFHHPKKHLSVDELDLISSIELLRYLLLEMNK